MMRSLACGGFILSFVFVLGEGVAEGQAAKNQMVKGTIKTVDTAKDVLIVNQKLKNEVVDRELSILDTTEFVVITNGAKKEVTGKSGLRLLEGKEGSKVAVKCDKDVNVLKVTVTIK